MEEFVAVKTLLDAYLAHPGSPDEVDGGYLAR
jgi:hypothetical protein